MNQLVGTCKKCGNPYFGDNVSVSYSGQLCRCAEPKIELTSSVITIDNTQKKIEENVDRELRETLSEAFDKDYLGEDWAVSEITAYILSLLKQRDKEIVEMIESDLQKLTTYYDGLESTQEKSANLAIRQSFLEIINKMQNND